MTDSPYLVERMQGFGTTIFADMSALAVATGSINLGQGFPDEDGPAEVLDAAIAAIRDGHNQYPPGIGIPELRHTIVAHEAKWYSLEYDAGTEVLVTAGATEAIAAALLALCEPGSDVVTFEPYYDSYAACIALAGAHRRVVQLRTPDWSFDADTLERAITPNTRVLLLNSPHNPTGKVFSVEELELIARVCVEHDLIAITDEVYEHLVFDGQHIPLATMPGMRERTVTISSGGKTFSCTGWKIGWLCAPPDFVDAIKTVKQFLTYVNGGPFQYGIAIGLGLPGSVFRRVAAELGEKRDRLRAGLTDAGLTVLPSDATYFLTVDITSIGETDGLAFCRSLPERCGVVGVPSVAFYDDKAAGNPLVRFACCKRLDVIDAAVARLKDLSR